MKISNTLSIIIPVYNSNEAIRRQILYLNALNVPKWIEVIFVDHNSKDPVDFTVEPIFNAKIIFNPDPRPWAIASCFNIGARNAKGRYFLFTGIDHMINADFMGWAKRTTCDYGVFKRQYAILTPHGNIEEIDFHALPVSKNWISRKSFYELDGFDQRYDVVGGEDLDLLRRYIEYIGGDKKREDFIVDGIKLYMYPEKGYKTRPEFLNHGRLKYPRAGKEFINGIIREQYDREN